MGSNWKGISDIMKKFYRVSSKTYEHPCPGGKVKNVYKNVDDAFPLFIPGWNGKFENNLEAIKGAQVNMKAEYATNIQGLLYSLDELNQSLMITIRCAYIAYQNDPCGDDGFFKRQTEKIVQEQHRLTAYRVQIRSLITLAEMNPNNPERFLPVFQQISLQLGRIAVPEAATLEIAETRTIAKNWAEG